MKPEKLPEKIRGRDRNGRMRTWQVGDCVLMIRDDAGHVGERVRERIRGGCFLYQPIGTNLRIPACVLSRHSWAATSDMLKCPRVGKGRRR